MDWKKANEICGVGTFVLTVVMATVLLWQTTGQLDDQPQRDVVEPLVTWWPILVVSLAVVIAACIHYLAATATNRDAAVIRDGMITAKDQEIESLKQQVAQLQKLLSER